MGVLNMPFDEARHKELQSALNEKMASNTEIADSFKIEDGTVIVDAEQKAAFDKNMVEIKDIQGLLHGMDEMKRIQEWGEQTTSKSLAAEVDAVDASDVNVITQGFQSVGAAFLASDEFKALAGGHNGVNMPSPFEYKTELASMEYKDVYSSMPTGTPGQFGRVERDAIVIPPKRKSRVRDLFPSRRTTAAIIEYFRMTGFTNNAAMVAEYASSSFGAKPQSTMTFVGAQSPVRTLAHWEAAHRNVLSDEPQLRSIIDNELLYGLRLEEDDQILNGIGTGENLEGILQNSDIQSYSWSAGASSPVADTKADAIRRAATLAFLAYYEPSGVVLHPNDWEDIELNKDLNGQYLMAVSIQQGAEARLWRMPVIDTPAIAEGTALVGAFGTGAQLYDRETANIRISEQHEDFFVRNAIVILAEQRMALAVKRPESFVEVTFDAAPPSA
jgi:HK97 family phage major capsid protein